MIIFSQCAIHHFRHHGPAGSFGKSVSQTSVDIWHFQSFYAIMCNIGHQVDIINVKLTFFLPFGRWGRIRAFISSIVSFFVSKPNASALLSQYSFITPFRRPACSVLTPISIPPE